MGSDLRPWVMAECPARARKRIARRPCRRRPGRRATSSSAAASSDPAHTQTPAAPARWPCRGRSGPGRVARRQGSRSTDSAVQSQGSRYRSPDDRRHGCKAAGQSALSRCAAQSSSAARREHGRSARTGHRSCGTALAGAGRRPGQSPAPLHECRPDAGRTPAGPYRSHRRTRTHCRRLTPPGPEVIARDAAEELPGHPRETPATGHPQRKCGPCQHPIAGPRIRALQRVPPAMPSPDSPHEASSNGQRLKAPRGSRTATDYSFGPGQTHSSPQSRGA